MLRSIVISADGKSVLTKTYAPTTAMTTVTKTVIKDVQETVTVGGRQEVRTKKAPETYQEQVPTTVMQQVEQAWPATAMKVTTVAGDPGKLPAAGASADVIWVPHDSA